jgi:DNA-binding SARP family transcriptional activator/tetratricopeptide (TPR) repeat protein
MRFSLLGPLTVADSTGNRIALAGPRVRVLLTALLLHANVPVPAEVLAETVWDGSPPPAAADTLRSYIRRLRQALGRDATPIVACDSCYLIHVDEPELDILEFEALCRDAREALRACEWKDASAAAVRALRLWRAAPLLDVAAEALRGEFVPRLERLRLQVLEDGFDAGLRLGQHQELIPQLLDITTKHPLQERFHAQLMLALASTGRRAQALHAYQEARRVLVDELGVEPGPELRDIHRQILVGDAAYTFERANVALPDKVPGATATGALAGVSGFPGAQASVRAPAEPAGLMPPRPAQLPLDIADFTGRRTQVNYLCDALTTRDVAGGPGAVPIVVVAGAAGHGKTALALHVAHRVRDHFPDGQLYVDLSGTAAKPAAPGEVLARFLRDLGVDGERVPAGAEERAAFYRTRLAGRRILIFLDNAKDAAQVRPLLPGSASCAVLVTTRNRTPCLVSTRFVDLNTMSRREAGELFSRIVGEHRSSAEPDATEEILVACAGLPLAIRICAARLAARGQWRITAMASRLRDERRRLDELQVGDLEVRASFQVSCDSLRPGLDRVGPGRAFRMLGLWQGQRISLTAAAVLIGGREQDVADALEALVDANLLESAEPDWYQFHDLLHLFAAEQAQAEEPEEERHEAAARLLRWYLGTAVTAADVLSPQRYRPPLDEPQAPGPLVSSVAAALAWYDSERENIIAAIRQAAASGLHDIAWRLATASSPLFDRRANWADSIAAHRIAVDSARADGSRQGEAWALQNLGVGLGRIGNADSLVHLKEALAIRRESGDRSGEGQTLISLTDAYYRSHGPEAAIECSSRALETLRQADNPYLLGVGLANHGEFCLALGRLDEAADSLSKALGTLSGTENVRADAIQNLGRVDLASGRPHKAIARLTEAYLLHVASGDLSGQAMALKYLGQAQREAGQEDKAGESLAVALVLFEKLRADVEAEEIRSTLEALTQLPGGKPGHGASVHVMPSSQS